ncbi:MAG TPA: flagellar biosynthetic protein FliO [Acidimicrobiales bacterium]|nr:flagellar biosynthetic protein FliO [Acidimicrobiales bacterium]
MTTFLLFGRMLLALGLVLGLMFVLSRLARRAQTRGRPGTRRATGGRTDPRVDVVTRRSLTRSSGIAVVRVGGRYLVVATTPQSINLITELDPAELGEVVADAPVPQSPRPSLLENLPLPRTAGASAAFAAIAPPSAWDAFLTTLKERTVRR